MATKKEKLELGSDRRDFLKTAGKTFAAAGVISALPALTTKAWASKRDYILIGHPNPSTGPLADFGEATPWADELAVAAINEKGGIYIKELGKKLPIKVKYGDTESSPSKAGEVAARMILKDKVDLMIALHTPDTVNPVTAICERYKMPCISLDAPIEPWLTGGPYKWTYHAFWKVDTIADLFMDMWDTQKTNKVVGCYFPNDVDGMMWSKLFHEKLPKRGYKLVDPGRFPYFNKDFSSFVNEFKKEKVEIVTGCLIPPDWATALRQMHQMSFVPEVMTIGKAILFPSSVGALGGDLANGLSSELWWSPSHPFKSSISGETGQQLVDKWTNESGKQWTTPIPFKYAAYEIAYDALSRAQSLDKEAIRDAIGTTNLDTVVGHIQYNAEHYAETPVVGGQWVKGDRWPWEIKIVNNGGHDFIPVEQEMFPIK
ncbi:MAG: ABC transporter substrate-binding protein [Desulfuromusa sp.]|nr:ABC transporter substrate-binding protein [Desulfuromusa sp.]